MNTIQTLKRSHRILSGLGLIANFVERPLRVGDIVLHDDDHHIVWGNIEDFIPGFSLEGKTVESNKTDLKYTVESGINITIGGSGGSALVKGDVQLRFDKANSAFISLSGVQRTSVKLGLIDEELSVYWKKRGFDKLVNHHKYHFISEIIAADSGTVIFSEEKGNKVVLRAQNDLPITDLTMISAGKVELKWNVRSTLEVISETPFQPLYSAVRYKGNEGFELVG